MGTRADFYIGCDSEAEWLGSVAWDGYLWAEDSECPLMAATKEARFRTAVDDILLEADHSTRPDMGWPWPWATSATTDFVYWFDGFSSHHAVFDNEHSWPDMSARANTTLGRRSGLIIIGPREKT